MLRLGPATLDASTTCWRAPGRRANHSPMMVSVAPLVSALAGTAYISAVSMKLTPAATARSRMAWASSWPTCSPKVMVPRQTGHTDKSLRPSGTRAADKEGMEVMARQCAPSGTPLLRPGALGPGQRRPGSSSMLV